MTPRRVLSIKRGSNLAWKISGKYGVAWEKPTRSKPWSLWRDYRQEGAERGRPRDEMRRFRSHHGKEIRLWKAAKNEKWRKRDGVPVEEARRKQLLVEQERRHEDGGIENWTQKRAEVKRLSVSSQMRKVKKIVQEASFIKNDDGKILVEEQLLNDDFESDIDVLTL